MTLRERLCRSTVGEKGRVFSFEVSEEHLKISRRNVAEWAGSWDLRQGERWPCNIVFHSVSVQEARDHLEEGTLIDAVSPNDCGLCVIGPGK